jgi:hypothetical protein
MPVRSLESILYAAGVPVAPPHSWWSCLDDAPSGCYAKGPFLVALFGGSSDFSQ